MFVLSLHSWHDPVDQLLKLSKERGVNIITPKLGQLVTINDDYRNVEWWLGLKSRVSIINNFWFNNSIDEVHENSPLRTFTPKTVIKEILPAYCRK